MSFFFQQLKLNLEILLENIAIKYNLNKNELMKLYLPKKSKKIELSLTKSCDVNKLNYNIFKDRNNNLYYIIDNSPIKYNEIYDSIKLNKI